MKWLPPVLAALALAACTTPTVFAPMQRADGPGFSETRIEADRWRITFRGGSDAGPDRVSDLTLLRAAQLTLQQGFDWFRITQRFGEAQPPRGPFLSVGGGTSSYGWGGGSAVGVGVSGIPLGGGQMLSETIEVVMGRGPTPQGDPSVYDARDVSRSIRA
jgi:hypothetical protein